MAELIDFDESSRMPPVPNWVVQSSNPFHSVAPTEMTSPVQHIHVAKENRSKTNTKYFHTHCPSYCGTEDKMSSVEWTKEAMDLLTMLLKDQPEYVHYFALLKLTGDAATNVKPKGRTVAALIKNFQEHLIDKLRNLTAFKSSTRDTIKEDALDVLEQVGDMPIGPECHI